MKKDEKNYQYIVCKNCLTTWRIERSLDADIIAELMDCPLCGTKED